MIKRLILPLMVIFAISATAQTSCEQRQRYIEVRGSGEVKVTPDIAYVSITINESDPATRDLSQAQKRMYSALKSLGIDVEKSLSIDNLSSSYIKRKQGGKSINYTLRLTDISLTGRVFDALTEIGIAGSRVARTEVSSKQQAQTDARKKAVANAREKAETLAEATQVKIGKPIFIVDNTMGDASGVRYMTKANVMYDAAVVGEDADIDLDFKEVDFSAMVTIRYEIE